MSPKPEQTAGGDDSLRALAEQHCGQLGEKANVDACVSQIVQDISAGRTQPIIPTFDADACETIKDPAEQHRCHGQVGRNFAVASGDMKFCDAIPQDEIRVSCRTAIIVNEVKKLYALDNNAAGSIEP